MNRLVRITTSFSSQSQNSKRIIFIFGPPGVGKGTYAKMLVKDLQLNHISTGD
jgi:adenylate kinase